MKIYPQNPLQTPDWELAFAAEAAMKSWPLVLKAYPDGAKLQDGHSLLSMAAYLTADILHGFPAGTCLLYANGAMPVDHIVFLANFIAVSDNVVVPDEWPVTQEEMQQAWAGAAVQELDLGRAN
jgi:hypothetical protein